MKKLLLSLLTLLALNAAAEEPIISFHSDAYKEIGAGNLFSIFLGATEDSTEVYVDCGAGEAEYELKVARINTSTGEFEGTWIPVSVNAEGNVKIYGDASKIEVIYIQGGYITDINMDRCTNLAVIDLSHNALRRLDLTPFTNAYAIYLTDNPFTAETPLVVGTPKPELQILELDIIDHLSPAFNLSDYPALVSFDGYHNRALTSIDPTGCPELAVMSLELTDVASVDVSKNPKLVRLNISETRITEIDLSHNTLLQHFLATHDSGVINTDVRLKGIDLSHNPNLILLNLSGNYLGTIDLSANTKLTNLNLRRNGLKSIDIGACTALYSVDLMYNDMDFATLPLPRNTFGEYFYQENPLKVDRSYPVGAVIDLSDRILRDGTVTTATVWRKPVGGEAVEADSTTWSYADGKVTLLAETTDSIYVTFANDVLYEYAESTTPFVVKSAAEFGRPTAVVAMTMPKETSALSFDIDVTGDTRKMLLSFGADTVEVTAGHVEATVPASFSGTLTLLQPEGELLTGLSIDGTTLYAADVTNATELQTLAITNAGLYSIDLSRNRCLRSLDLSGNNLTKLDLTGVYGDYEKTSLTDLKAANNKLTEVKIVMNRQIVNMDLSHNLLTAFDFTNFTGLRNIDLSSNRLAGELSIVYLYDATDINLSDNEITSFRIDGFNALHSFNISSNRLTFATLPSRSAIPAQNYVYAPQKPIELQPQAPAVNLSAQNLNGATSYTWKQADGTALTPSDVDCRGGASRFLNTAIGKIYCEMTNPAFPGLTLTTTEIQPVDAPTNVIATFTPATGTPMGELTLTASKPTAIYIDWRGDGSEYKEYVLGTSYINFETDPKEGVQAKVYTYGSADELTVFSLTGLPLSQVDIEKLSNLVCINISSPIDEQTRANTLDIKNVKLPETAPSLRELTLKGCGMTAYPYAGRYPSLYSLNLSGNNFATFDASVEPGIGCLYLGDNLIKRIRFNNPELWELQLSLNILETIDLNGLPQLQQLHLNSNYLSAIDLTPVKSSLKVLSLVENSFTFATLPVPSDYDFYVYYYGRQDPIQIEVVNGKVDLRKQAVVKDTPTTYTWYIGEAVYDSESGTYSGEALAEGEEYTVNDGLTSFLETFSEQVQCVMSNSEFPNLQLTTNRVSVTETGIEEISAADRQRSSGVYDLQGRRVSNPSHGLYIVNGKKTIIK